MSNCTKKEKPSALTLKLQQSKKRFISVLNSFKNHLLNFVKLLRLKNAKGLESDYDDPNLSQEIHSKLSHLVATLTPADLKKDMSGILLIKFILI